MPVAEARVRTNGFQWPLNPFQLISWVVVALDVLLFAIIGIPLIESDALKVLISLCFGASVVILVLGAYSATSCDPADPHIRRQDHGVQVAAGEILPYCPQCDSPVFARSKHCRACNKCVREFDHHCMWMNNCIGAENYKAFAVCIGSVAVMTANILGINVYLLIEFFMYGEAFEIRWNDHFLFKDVEKEIALIPCLFLTLVNLPFFLLDMQLVLLHIWLTREGVTTYEYIMKIKRSDDQIQDGQEQGGRRRNSFRKLPSCLDWIVVDRKKMKKHQGNKAASEKASVPPSESETPEVSEVEVTSSPDSAPPAEPPSIPPATAPPAAPQATTPASSAEDVAWSMEGSSEAPIQEDEPQRRNDTPTPTPTSPRL